MKAGRILQKKRGADMRKIEPVRIFELFKEISQVPRCTGDEEAIGNYILDFAHSNELEAYKDAIGNVIVKKKGSQGYETVTPIILQGHMDMLCIKDRASSHDFTKDPIEMSVSGDLIVAEETSLGSDNGMAMAFYLALLESDRIAHPPLEVIFTVQEQAGLVGARELDVSGLYGRYLINMDSESEGEFIIGCAGEQRVKVELPLEKVEHEHDVQVFIKLFGLKGGHSGLNIHLNRGNAAQMLALIYKKLSEEIPMSLVSMSAGEKYNVIPHYGELRVTVPHDSVKALKDKMLSIKTFMDAYVNEEDYDFEFDICPVDKKISVLEADACEDLIDLLLTIPNGVNIVSERSSELIDTSLNIGTLRIYDDKAVIKLSIRGITEERLDFAVDRIRSLSKLTGGNFEVVNTYPAWNDEGDNHLRRIFKEAYTDQFGEAPAMRSIHAGLECSILAKKLNQRKNEPPIEMISFGPDIFDAHTPNEAVSISSVRRTWGLFQYILKQMTE